MASTAIGSVGEMSAPNRSAAPKGSSNPARLAPDQVRTATKNVESTTPTVARVRIGHRCGERSVKLTCSAPANRRKLSIPFMRSSLSVNVSSSRALPRSRPPAAIATETSEATSAPSMTPIGVGSLRSLSFV
jgi:hypothetical protein